VSSPEAGRRQARRLDLKHGQVELVHGAGGRAMTDLVDLMFREAFANPLLDQGNDQARFAAPPGDLVMSTDSFVVSPLFFPGGNIGSLAVHGTVNDLAMGGAEPMYLSAGFILEEGFPLGDLARIVEAMAAAASSAGVSIVTGDTKVVERGKADGVFINTAGLGRVLPGLAPEGLSGAFARPGDRVLVSGTIGDHGVTIMSLRSGLGFTTSLESDSCALNGLVCRLVEDVGEDLHCLRDPTRGGVSATLNEIAAQASVGIRLEEDALPIKPQVRGACELLGLDPLNVANECKLLAIVAPDAAEAALAAMHDDPRGADAAIIGEVIEDPLHLLRMRTAIGGERVIDWLHGEQLPRIC
jgi:hydrogenase expression/formation protein HypE